MSTVATLPRHFREAVVKEFAGEAILWAGRPSSSQTFRATALIWFFAVPWTAFSLVWEFMALQMWLSSNPSPAQPHTVMGVIAPLFGLPFVLIGLGIMSVPFLAWSRARKTVHVVTARRFVTMMLGRRLDVK